MAKLMIMVTSLGNILLTCLPKNREKIKKNEQVILIIIVDKKGILILFVP